MDWFSWVFDKVVAVRARLAPGGRLAARPGGSKLDEAAASRPGKALPAPNRPLSKSRGLKSRWPPSRGPRRPSNDQSLHPQAPRRRHRPPIPVNQWLWRALSKVSGAMGRPGGCRREGDDHVGPISDPGDRARLLNDAFNAGPTVMRAHQPPWTDLTCLRRLMGLSRI